MININITESGFSIDTTKISFISDLSLYDLGSIFFVVVVDGITIKITFEYAAHSLEESKGKQIIEKVRERLKMRWYSNHGRFDVDKIDVGDELLLIDSNGDEHDPDEFWLE